MATKTRRELVIQALANLFVSSPGQVASDDDYTTCDGYVDGLIDTLANREVVYIQDVNAIEALYFTPLAICLADACKSEFGGAQLPVEQAESQLRLMSRSGPTYEVLEGEYI